MGHVIDIHDYEGVHPAGPNKTRASILGEFGGLGLNFPQHTYQHGKNASSYLMFETAQELNSKYLAYLEEVKRKMLDPKTSLSAIIYTELTDVEHEVAFALVSVQTINCRARNCCFHIEILICPECPETELYSCSQTTRHTINISHSPYYPYLLIPAKSPLGSTFPVFGRLRSPTMPRQIRTAVCTEPSTWIEEVCNSDSLRTGQWLAYLRQVIWSDHQHTAEHS